MKKKTLNILFFFLISFLISGLFTSNTKSQDIDPRIDLAGQRIAPSVCLSFINKIIDNYDLIKDHKMAGYTDDYFGLDFQYKWNPEIEAIDKYNEDKTSVGDLIFRRNNSGSIFIRNIYPNMIDKIDLRPGDEIISINKKDTKEYSDLEIDEIFDEKSNSIEINYKNKEGLIKNTVLKTHKVYTSDKWIDFNILSFNSIDSKTFTTEFYIYYAVSGEVWDGVNKKIENDELYKIANETFSYTTKEGKKEIGGCTYSDEEINQMQIILPSWTVELLNKSYESKDQYDRENVFDVWEKDINNSYSSLDVYSDFKGIVKTKNNFDLRTFPFDKQQLIFKFAELDDPDVRITTYDSVYSNLYEFSQKKDVIPGWKLTDTKVEGFNYQGAGWYTDAFGSGLTIILEIEREFQYYLFKIIVPILLILIVCWSVFWIDPLELESKLTITIVCLLSLIAYNFVVSEDIPKLSYLTIMDYIILISYIYATLPNFLSIASYHLSKKNTSYNYNFLGVKYKLTSALIDKKSRIYGPLSYLFIVFIIIIYNISGSDNTSALLSWLKI